MLRNIFIRTNKTIAAGFKSRGDGICGEELQNMVQ